MIMLRIIAIFLCLGLTSCSTYPPVQSWTSGQKNACLPEAAVMVQGLKKAEIQSRVLCITTPEWGHAVAVYLYPPGQNQLWVWDSTWKSIRVRAWWDDPQDITYKWAKALGKNIIIKKAEFLE